MNHQRKATRKRRTGGQRTQATTHEPTPPEPPVSRSTNASSSLSDADAAGAGVGMTTARMMLEMAVKASIEVIVIAREFMRDDVLCSADDSSPPCTLMHNKVAGSFPAGVVDIRRPDIAAGR